MTLREALRALASIDANRSASPRVEARLRDEVRAIARRRTARSIVVSALTAAAVVTIVLLSRGRGRPPLPQDGAPSTIPEVTTAFMPLPFAAVPVENGQIVRLQVSRAALVSYGLLTPDLADAAASGMVIADVIVGDDGLARAVRFVRPGLLKESAR